jgi:hypothetical protein
MSFIFSASLAVPFFFIWNNLAPTYFYFLPVIYLNIPFWDTVGLFMIIPILKHMLVPTLVRTSSSTNTSKE